MTFGSQIKHKVFLKVEETKLLISAAFITRQER